MKLALIVGHHQNSKGAVSPFFGKSEWDFYNEVVKHLRAPNVDVYKHNPNTKGYSKRQKETAKIVESNGNYDLVIELHFNASNSIGNGIETLYYFESAKGKEYAKKFSDTVQKWTGLKLRANNGVKALYNKTQRGFGFVASYNAVAILIEPFFGDNYKDCEAIKSPENMACIIKDFIETI